MLKKLLCEEVKGKVVHQYVVKDQFGEIKEIVDMSEDEGLQAHNLWNEGAKYDFEDKAPKHYNNSNGSLYKFAEEQGLNSWEFDILKRTIRCRKKGQFKEDLEKTKHVIELYLKEYKNTDNQ